MSEPSNWLVQNAALLPRPGRALDVACGRGRHALWLAAAGFETDAVDSDADSVAFLQEEAVRRGLSLRASVLDLEAEAGASLGCEDYDLIVVIHYLHRSLFPALRAALREGGVLVYETFTTKQAARGKPTNPRYLLKEGELRRLVEPLTILRYREGEFENRMVAGVIAQRSRRR